MRKEASLICVVVVAASASAQDINTTRFLGMGGAGMALPIGVGSRGSLNPALYAYGPKRFSLDAPSLGYHTAGVTTSSLRRDLKDLTSGKNISSDKATQLARDLGKQISDFGAELGDGFLWDGFHLAGESEANVATFPNAPLQREAQAGVFQDLNDNLDAYGYGYWGLDLGYGHTLPLPSHSFHGELTAGLNVRFVHSYYAHRFISGNEIIQSGSSQPGFASEMNGKNTLNKSGVGLDFGLNYGFGNREKIYLGAAVHNLIEPRNAYASTFPDEQGFGFPGEVNFNPFKRHVDAGIGYMPSAKLGIAADFVDMGNNAQMSEFRTGVDYTVNKWLNLQAGYGTRRSYVVGVGVGFFNVAIGPKIPLSLTGLFRF